MSWALSVLDQSHRAESMSAEEAVNALEHEWHSQYLKLLPLMGRMKRISASQAGLSTTRSTTFDDLDDDYFLLFYQFSKAVEAVLAEVTLPLPAHLLSSKCEFESAVVRALQGRSHVIAGDLYRYLDKFRLPKTESAKIFSKAVQQYLSALGWNREDGKAFSGLYIVSAHSGRVLQSLIYLLRSATVGLAFHTSVDVFAAAAGRIGSSPSELRDVPFAARSFVALVVELGSYHLTGAGSDTERIAEIGKLMRTAVPGKDIADPLPVGCTALPVVPWDALLVVFITDLLRFRPDGEARTGLEDALKLVIGRALQFKRLVTVLALMEYSGPKLAPVIRAVEREALASFTQSHFSATTANQPLAIDHLLTLQSSAHVVSEDAVNAEEVAAARICEKCGIPWGTAPQGRTVSDQRVVVIDAANVACRAGEGTQVAEIDGVIAAHEYWTSRGYVVKVFVSDRHAKRNRSGTRSAASRSRNGIEINLDAIYELLDAKSIVSVPAQNYDDSYMIAYALRMDGVIVSNDMFRDWVAKLGGKELEAIGAKWMQTHVIAYTLVDGMYFPNPDFVMPPPSDNSALIK